MHSQFLTPTNQREVPLLLASQRARRKQRQAILAPLPRAKKISCYTDNPHAANTPSHTHNHRGGLAVACRGNGINAIAASKQPLAMDAAAGLESLSVVLLRHGHLPCPRPPPLLLRGDAQCHFCRPRSRRARSGAQISRRYLPEPDLRCLI